MYRNISEYMEVFALRLNKEQNKNAKINGSTSNAEFIVEYEGDLLKLQSNLNAEIEVVCPGFAIVSLPEALVSQLGNYKEIKYFEQEEPLKYFMHKELNRTAQRTGQAPNPLNLTGKGTLAAVIDSGIDFHHAEFLFQDGTSRIIYIWDQTLEGQPPSGFSLGSEYTKKEIDLALEANSPECLIKHTDITGTGTAAAGLLAGNLGLAPKASIIAVKTGTENGNGFFSTTKIIRAVKYCVDKAKALNMPISICISPWSSNTNSLFYAFMDKISLEWKVSISAASDNNSIFSYHYSCRTANNEIKENKAYIPEKISGFYVKLWRNVNDTLSVQFTSPLGTMSQELNLFDKLYNIQMNGVHIEIHPETVQKYKTYQEIHFHIYSESSDFIEGLWNIIITGQKIIDGRYGLAFPSPIQNLKRSHLSFFPSGRKLSVPYNESHIIKTAPFVENIDHTVIKPTRNDYLKSPSVPPDITASHNMTKAPEAGHKNGYFSGNAIAVCRASGLALMVMEWSIVRGNNPSLYGFQLKLLMQNTAEKEDNIEYPHPKLGHGKICTRNTINALLGYEKAMGQNISQTVSAKNTTLELTLDEFINLPTTVDFHTIYNQSFINYIKDKPYIRVGTILHEAYVIAYTSEDRIEQVVAEIGEDRVSVYPFILGLLDAESLEEAGIRRVHQNPYLNLTGRGTVITFIDTGIDYTNPAFIYEDGTSKIQYIWDQTIDGNRPDDLHFGALYTREDINKALASDNPYEIVPHVDNVGHGTFLASVACGRENNRYIGAAPDAEIIAVKLRKAHPYYLRKYLVPPNQDNAFQSSDAILGAKFALSRAEENDSSIVFCTSIGSNFGNHKGNSYFERRITTLSSYRGIAFCTAAGNESDAKHHTNGNIRLGENLIKVRVNGEIENFSFDLWNPAWDRISVSIKSPTGDTISRMPIRYGFTYRSHLLLERSTIDVTYHTGTHQLTSIQVINPFPGIWEIMLHDDFVINGDYHAWMPIRGLISPQVEFLNPNPNYTIVIPATSIGSITVGAYNGATNSIYASSSWGPTPLPMISPDFVAPGVNVGGVYPYGYGTMTGTSVAAAIAAGASALLFQWGTEVNDTAMNGDRVRSLLISGTQRNPVREYPNMQWGYGTLNLQAAFERFRNI